MSKSKGNVINPDEYISDYGAYAFRMYIMFMGTYLEGGDFRNGGVQAMKSFLDRLWTAALPEDDGGKLPVAKIEDQETKLRLHSTVKAITGALIKMTAPMALYRSSINWTRNKVNQAAKGSGGVCAVRTWAGVL